MNNTFTFETREEYLAWKQEWIAEYNSIGIAIRTAKKNIKQFNREEAWAKLSAARHALYQCKKTANSLIEIRLASKIAAGEARERRLAMEIA